MKKLNVRAMTEGAILAAMTAILGVFYNVPIASFATMFWPVPIIIVGYRNGFRVSFIAAFIAALLVSVIVSPITGVILFLTYALPGAVMGYLIRKQKSPYKTILIGGLILSVTAMIEFILSLELVLGIKITEILGNLGGAMNGYYNMMNTQMLEVAGLYRQFGIDEATIQQVMDTFEVMIQQMMIIMPSALVATGIIVSYLNFKAVKVILGRIGYKIEDVKKFSQWSFNKPSKYAILTVTVAVLLLAYTKSQFLYETYTNVWLILQLIYTGLGLSVGAYFIEKLSVKYEIPKAVRGIILVFLFPLFIGILPYIGMVDIAADIRRLERNISGGVQ